jgi:exopolysaccharide biosynthesis polyprenyl glycosylphosphotransferase
MIRPLKLQYLLFFIVSDMLVICGALVLSAYLRVTLEIGISGPNTAFATPTLLFAIASIIWLIAFWQANVYSPHHHLRHHLRRILTGHSMAALLFLGTLYVVYRDYSRLQAFYFIAISLLGVIVHRAIAHLLMRVGVSSSARRVLIVGDNAYARQIGATIAAHRWANLHLVGFIGDEPTSANDVLGTIDRLDELVAQYEVDEVLIYIRWFNDAVFERVAEIVRVLQGQAVNIRLAPDYTDLAYFYLTTEDFSGIPLIGVRDAILTPLQRVVKRAFDLVFASVVLLLTWPVLLLIGLAIRLDSPGPAIFRQLRVGQYGRPFMMLKFRTMQDGAHQPDKPSRHGDSRVTRVGAFLRRTSLDELPQLINVLRGEMSIVGPRPELPQFVEKYEWWQRKRFELPQGMTGWWQINGRAERLMYQHTEDDLFYIRHYSFWLDMQIVLRTILVVFTGRGAY